jgi:hypothetical protein
MVNMRMAYDVNAMECDKRCPPSGQLWKVVRETATIHEPRRPGTLCPRPPDLPAYADRLAMNP